MNDPVDRLYERLLVVRCQSGDQEAYRELVDRYGPRLRYFLRKLLPHGDRAEDLLQEVWIDVFRQLPRLQAAGAFTPWVYKIARGRAALELRRNGRAPPAADLPELAAATQEEPEFSPEDAARIHSVLDELPSDQRE